MLDLNEQIIHVSVQVYVHQVQREDEMSYSGISHGFDSVWIYEQPWASWSTTLSLNSHTVPVEDTYLPV